MSKLESKILKVKPFPRNLHRQKGNMRQMHSFLGQPDLWHHCRQALLTHKKNLGVDKRIRHCAEHIWTAEFSSFQLFPTLGFHTKSGLLMATSFASARISGSLSSKHKSVTSCSSQHSVCQASQQAPPQSRTKLYQAVPSRAKPCLHSSCGIN